MYYIKQIYAIYLELYYILFAGCLKSITSTFFWHRIPQGLRLYPLPSANAVLGSGFTGSAMLVVNFQEDSLFLTQFCSCLSQLSTPNFIPSVHVAGKCVCCASNFAPEERACYWGATKHCGAKQNDGRFACWEPRFGRRIIPYRHVHIVGGLLVPASLGNVGLLMHFQSPETYWFFDCRKHHCCWGSSIFSTEPQLPKGRIVTITILNTWGDLYFTGLTSLQVYCPLHCQWLQFWTFFSPSFLKKKQKCLCSMGAFWTVKNAKNQLRIPLFFDSNSGSTHILHFRCWTNSSSHID